METYEDQVMAVASEAIRAAQNSDHKKNGKPFRRQRSASTHRAYQILFHRAQSLQATAASTITEQMIVAGAALLCAKPRDVLPLANMLHRSVRAAIGSDYLYDKDSDASGAIDFSPAAICLAYRALEPHGFPAARRLRSRLVSTSKQLLRQMEAIDPNRAEAVARDFVGHTQVRDSNPLGTMARNRHVERDIAALQNSVKAAA